MEAKACKRGLGLCLSGGGFRASFYHIGVMARMAELDLLRHVEVISTVSGGSILGVAYYLKLKRLLEDKSDEEITNADYLELINALEAHFLSAVQKNLRMRTFANPLKNLRMSLPNYSRSDAVGEMYEKYIYKPLIDVSSRRIKMSDLLIAPKGHTGPNDFHPCDEVNGNSQRKNKVPVLVLNATSLNTGHNWYFTARSMGEVPPRNNELRDIDKKDRYRRVRYDEITSRTPDFNLASAVAASAAVPGLFPPMAVSNLYEDRRVQLVDGGVFDNQGISGTLDPDQICSDFVVSDASGQSDAEDNPGTGLVSTLGTTTSILIGRVREEMVNNLECGDHPGQQSKGVAYFHLTRGLSAREVSAIGQGAKTQADPTQPSLASSEQEFNVDADAQRALAHVRTDLDSFTHVEARCLEADAYQMSNPRLERLPDRYRAQEPSSGQWLFAPYQSRLADGDPLALKHIHVARAKFFKPLLHVLSGTAGFAKTVGLLLVSVPLVVVLIGIAYLINWALSQVMPHSLWQIVISPKAFQAFLFDVAPIVYAVLAAFVLSWLADRFIEGSGKWVVLIRRIAKAPMSVVTGLVTRLVLPVVFAIPIIVYVYTIDRYFVKVLGRLD